MSIYTGLCKGKLNMHCLSVVLCLICSFCDDHSPDDMLGLTFTFLVKTHWVQCSPTHSESSQEFINIWHLLFIIKWNNILIQYVHEQSDSSKKIHHLYENGLVICLFSAKHFQSTMCQIFSFFLFFPFLGQMLTGLLSLTIVNYYYHFINWKGSFHIKHRG